MRMPKSLLFILTILLTLHSTSCSLDIPLEDKVSDPRAISSVTAMRRATAAAYLSYAWHDYDIVFSILAEEFQPSTWLAQQSNDLLRYLWNDLSIRDEAVNLWQDHYKTIMLCNAVLERVDDIAASSGSDCKQRDALQGTVLLLKARCYLQLLQVFSAAPKDGDLAGDGIVLRDRVAFEMQPRSSIEASLNAILSLIDQALPLLKDNGVESENPSNPINWLNYPAGLLLKAQTALWKSDFETALKASEEVLDLKNELFKSSAEDRYKEMWTAKGTGDALYAHDQLEKQRGVPLYLNAIQYDSDKGDLYSIAPGTELEPGDARKGFYEIPLPLPNGQTMLLWGKYNYMNRNNIEFKVTYDLRLSEALFIAAESLAVLGRDGQAHDLLNEWLKSLGCHDIPASLMGDNLVKHILRLKMQEFRGEGTSYFDMKRWHRPAARFNADGTKGSVRIEPSDSRWVWPLPMAEVRTSNGKVHQNPGWAFEQ